MPELMEPCKACQGTGRAFDFAWEGERFYRADLYCEVCEGTGFATVSPLFQEGATS